MYKKGKYLIILILLCALSYSLYDYIAYENLQTFQTNQASRAHRSENDLRTSMVERHGTENNDYRVQGSYQCSEILNKTIHGFNDLNNYVKVCSREEASNTDHRKPTNVCESCRYKTPRFLSENKSFVALASYGGSGNSWTRELLESLTGVYTGSIYVDSAGKFPGSKHCPYRGGVYIIKTHNDDDSLTEHGDCIKMRVNKLYYKRAMYILRNPYDALLSAFNLVQTGDKLGYATRDAFQSEKWQNYIKSLVPEWKQMTLGWLTRFERPVHVIVYEDLQKDTVHELFKVGQFLQLNNSYLDLYCAKSCLKPKYHRAKPDWMNTFNLYDDDLRRTVNHAINDVTKALSLKKRDNIVKVMRTYIMLPNTVIGNIKFFLGI